MKLAPNEVQTIDLDVLQPGTCLIDRHQRNEKVVRRVEQHDSFVRLFSLFDSSSEKWLVAPTKEVKMEVD